MRKIIPALLLFITGLMFLNSCEQNEKTINNRKHRLLMASLFQYYASEYKALTYQAYNLASERIIKIRKERPQDENLAVVLDIDETVLDNSSFEARMVLVDSIYNPTSWTVWSNLAAARPIPGSLRFLKLADSLGYNIFYLSNREKAKEQQATIRNLDSLGFPQAEASHVLLEETTGNKEPRRQYIREKYDIVLFVGDNLGDFYEDTHDYATRERVLEKNRDQFGDKFIVLPNTIYGRWVSSLKINHDPEKVDSLLRVMVSPYEK